MRKESAKKEIETTDCRKLAQERDKLNIDNCSKEEIQVKKATHLHRQEETRRHEFSADYNKEWWPMCSKSTLRHHANFLK